MSSRRRRAPSVTIPRVPSAPMKSFVVSNPADDFRARRRVLMTSPDGSTTVYKSAPTRVSLEQLMGRDGTNRVKEPFRLRGTIPHGIRWNGP